MLAVGNIGNDIILSGALLNIFEGAGLAEHILLHLFLCCLGDIDLIVRNLVISRDFEFKLRSLSNIEFELEIVACLPLILFLVLRRERLPYYAKFLVLDKVVKSIGNDRIDRLIEGLVPIKPLDKGKRCHSSAEAPDISFSLGFIKSLTDSFGVVFICYRNGDLYVEIINLILGNIHKINRYYCYYYFFRDI